MNTRTTTTMRSIGLVSAGLLAGGLIAVGGAAFADDSTPGPSTSQSAPSAPSLGDQPPPLGAPHQGQPPKGVPGGKDPMRSDEKSVTAEQAATLSEIAKEKVPGGTVVRVETDAGDAAFEVHMTKADGTAVTVTFNKDLAFTAVQDGMGLGDPAPQGPPPGAPQGGMQGAAPSGSIGG